VRKGSGIRSQRRREAAGYGGAPSPNARVAESGFRRLLAIMCSGLDRSSSLPAN
jgi:hypothetical protein